MTKIGSEEKFGIRGAGRPDARPRSPGARAIAVAPRPTVGRMRDLFRFALASPDPGVELTASDPRIAVCGARIGGDRPHAKTRGRGARAERGPQKSRRAVGDPAAGTCCAALRSPGGRVAGNRGWESGNEVGGGFGQAHERRRFLILWGLKPLEQARS
ncbi:hypothetical protein GCM10022205_59510 [Spinactinospora alkalitolerans]